MTTCSSLVASLSTAIPSHLACKGIEHLPAGYTGLVRLPPKSPIAQ